MRLDPMRAPVAALRPRRRARRPPKTIRASRERLTKSVAIHETGYIPMSGQIIDASLVSTPKQRNIGPGKADITEAPPRTGRMSRRSCARRTAMRWTVVFAKAREREDGTGHADIAIAGLRRHITCQHRPASRLHPAVRHHRCVRSRPRTGGGQPLTP